MSETVGALLVFLLVIIALAALVAFFARKGIRRNEDDIQRMLGTAIALEKALHMTLAVSIIKPPPRVGEDDRDDVIDTLIARWEDAQVSEMSFLWQTTPQLKEGYQLIHKGLLQALQDMKRKPTERSLSGGWPRP